MQALSNAWPLDRACALDRAAVVLQLGPALSVKGGVSAVERMIVDSIGQTIELHHIGTTVDGAFWRKLRAFVGAMVTLQRALRRDRKLLVHIHFASRGSTLRKTILAAMTLRAGRPLILHAHGGAFDRFFDDLPAFLQRAVQRTFARADRLIVLSTQWRDFYIRRLGMAPSKVTILRNPTVLPRRIPQRCGRDRVQFLFLGRIEEQKGVFDILSAFAALPDELRCRARLVFAGDGDAASLIARAGEHARSIELHAWVDIEQRNALLAASDVFLLPSYREGLPMALLEAMAFGLPVITTGVGGIPDIVSDGREGALVEPGNVPALTSAMRRLIEDESLRIELGTRARQRAERFDVSHFSAELVRIYGTVLR
jgi:glycosyltransferase involved in cell wall biosynthesis